MGTGLATFQEHKKLMVSANGFCVWLACLRSVGSRRLCYLQMNPSHEDRPICKWALTYTWTEAISRASSSLVGPTIGTLEMYMGGNALVYSGNTCECVRTFAGNNQASVMSFSR